MNKIGFHIMNAAGANSGWVQRFNSAVHLVLAIGVNGEIPLLLQQMQTNPNSRFIYRAWTYGELGQSDHFESYYAKYGTDPLPLIRAHEPTIQALQQYGLANRCAIQLFNETGHDEYLWPGFIQFNANFVKEMDRRGLSAAVLGLGPGHPAWNTGSETPRESIRRSWFAARPLFEAINAAKETHLVNLHEYHAFSWQRFEPWVIGRYRWMLEDVQLMGLPIDKIKVVIGESGFTDPNSLGYPSPTGPNGYRWSMAQGYTPQQLAEDYADMVKNVYQHPNLLGLCYYGLGSDPGWWEEFDLLKEPAILQRLEQLLVHEELPVVTDTEEIKFNVLSTGLRVRELPTRDSAIKYALVEGQVITTNGYIDAAGYRWRRLVSGGYAAEYQLMLPASPYLAEVPDTKKSLLAQLAHMQLELDVMKEMVAAL